GLGDVYKRQVRSSENVSPEGRVQAAIRALGAAQRVQEKKQAVAALAAVRHRKAAEALMGLLADPVVGVEAGQAALGLAEALRGSERDAARKLAEAVRSANLSPELNKRAEQSLNRK
ncbi:MAG: hypothetical protein N3B01_07990, partial [Verrucomicrobiae bacterium]|nr:hypothetical protein [Verrucomicrobiae bacterium]